MKFHWTVVLWLSIGVTFSSSERILVLFPIPIKSHAISFSPLLHELVQRGHQLTVVSGFPLQPPMVNRTDIHVNLIIPEKFFSDIFSLEEEKSSFSMITNLYKVGLLLCEQGLQHPEIQKLMKTENIKFDLIVLEIFFSECFYGFIHKFQAPLVHISSNTVTIWMGDGVGNPHTASYISDLFLPYTSNMRFPQRIMNALMGAYSYVSRELYYIPRQEAIMRQYFDDPSLPSISEMEKNASLLLINHLSSLSSPRPFTPNTIEVGGMHIKPSKKLPQKLQRLMDEATDGVIYFSLGSLVRPKDMPHHVRQSFLDIFSTMKQKVLWKWDEDSIPGKPDNLYIAKWLPQNDILGHPNMRAFITHCGLLSTQEAAYHGVPLLAIPVAVDQNSNSAHAEAKGYAIVLRFSNITSTSLRWALSELLYNPRYREGVKRVSAIIKDQPETSLERAVFWTEYVMRHKGAVHLRSAALDLWWYQYYLLDVLAVLLGAFLILCMTSRIVYYSVSRSCSTKNIPRKHKSKKD